MRTAAQKPDDGDGELTAAGRQIMKEPILQNKLQIRTARGAARANERRFEHLGLAVEVAARQTDALERVGTALLVLLHVARRVDQLGLVVVGAFFVCVAARVCLRAATAAGEAPRRRSSSCCV